MEGSDTEGQQTRLLEVVRVCGGSSLSVFFSSSLGHHSVVAAMVSHRRIASMVHIIDTSSIEIESGSLLVFMHHTSTVLFVLWNAFFYSTAYDCFQGSLSCPKSVPLISI